jgi:hypothetical protein
MQTRFRYYAYSSARVPHPFSSSYEEEFEIPITVIAGRLASESGRDTFGAFSGTELVGTVGFGREEALKLAHKGFIRGMYVSAAFRNQGIGGNLSLTRCNTPLIEWSASSHSDSDRIEPDRNRAL